MLSVDFGNGIWVAGGSSGNILYSTDGSNWNWSSGTGDVAGDVHGIAHNNRVLVAVTTDEILFSADDGDTWNLAADSGDYTEVYGVSAGP